MSRPREEVAVPLRCTQIEDDGAEQHECGKAASHYLFGDPDLPICDDCLAGYRADPDWTEAELKPEALMTHPAWR